MAGLGFKLTRAISEIAIEEVHNVKHATVRRDDRLKDAGVYLAIMFGIAACIFCSFWAISYYKRHQFYTLPR